MTTETAVAVRATEPSLTPFEVIERVIASGDLSKMSPQDRIAFYWRTCESTGLNPLTRPFEFINLSGKLTMYAKKDATDQLRRIHRVSIDELAQVVIDDILTVTATGHTPDGRQDQDVGSVNLKGLSGDARANATKKAITQAKRRLTLSLVGLGFLDESEIPEGAGADVDPTTGEIVERAKPKSLLESVKAQQEAMAQAVQDAPGADATTAQLPESTDEDAAAAGQQDEAVEGQAREAVEGQAREAGISRDELLAELERIGVSQAYAAETAKTMFPAGGLTDEQRREVLAKLVAEQTSAAL